MLNTLSVFLMTATAGIGLIIGVLLSMSVLEYRMLGQPEPLRSRTEAPAGGESAAPELQPEAQPTHAPVPIQPLPAASERGATKITPFGNQQSRIPATPHS